MSFLGYIDHCKLFFDHFRLKHGETISKLKYKALYGISIRGMQFFSKTSMNHDDVVQMLMLRAFNETDSPIVQHARSIIEKGDHVIEVGAFEGFYSIMLGHLVGPTGRITACEIMPSSAAVLKFNFKQNQFNGEVIAKGVSPQGGKTKVYCLTGQINGLKPDVIAQYDQNEQMKEIELDTLSLNQVFEQLNLDQKVKLLILQINGVEADTLKTFSYFDQVENLCFAMKYATQNQLWAIKEFLATKNMIVEFNAYFAYATHHSKLKVKDTYLLQRPIYVTDQVDEAPLLNSSSVRLPEHIQQSLFDVLNKLNSVSKSYQSIDLSMIIHFVQQVNQHYGEDFLSLEEIDLINYPYELVALLFNKIDSDLMKVLILNISKENSLRLSYLFLNLNPKLFKFNIEFSLTRV